MTNDDERGGRGVKNAENLMTSYVNDPYNGNHSYKVSKLLTGILQCYCSNLHYFKSFKTEARVCRNDGRFTDHDFQTLQFLPKSKLRSYYKRHSDCLLW